MTLRRSTKISFARVAAFTCLLTFYSLTTAVQHAGASDKRKEDTPPTLASMDYCADQYILALADKDQILALSTEATSVYSLFREQAAGIPQLRGTSEDMLALSPDIVVWQWKGSPAIDHLFGRADITSISVPFAGSPQAALDSLIAFGDRIGRGNEARTYVAARYAMQEKLNSLPASGLKALYITPSGYTAGGGTSVDAIIRSAGLETMAADYALHGWHPLPMELIVQAAPDVIITSFFDLPAPPSRWSLAQSPHIRDLLADLPVINLPADYLSCNGLFDIDAAYFIREQAQEMRLLED